MRAAMLRPDETGCVAHQQTAIHRSSPPRFVAARRATRKVGARSRWASLIQASVLEAAWRLVGHDDAHLVVMNGTRQVGVVNEQILAAQWPSGLEAAERVPLRELNLPEVQAVQEDDDVRDVAEIMVSGNCPAVLVVSRGAVIGLVTVRNLLGLLAGRPSSTSWPDDD